MMMKPASSLLFRMLLLSVAGVVFAVAGLSVLGLLGTERLGERAWRFDLLSHFRLQYWTANVLLLPALLLLLFRRSRLTRNIVVSLLVINLGVLLLNTSRIAPYYLGHPRAKADGATSLRIFHLNVLGKNRRDKPVIQAIAEADADIVDLQEYNTWWRTTLEGKGVFTKYPYRLKAPWGDDAVYSKVPLLNPRVERVPGSPHGADTSLITQVKLDGQTLTLLFSHPPTPVKKSLFERQQLHFDFWAKNRKAYGENLAIIGDLNTTPWSRGFRKLITGAGLRDSQLGFGLQPSFSTRHPYAQIPIDHALVSPNVIVLNRKTGGDVGSDHVSVTIDLALKPIPKIARR